MSPSQTTSRATRSRWWSLTVVAFATAMIILDATVVSVARPTIMEALNLSITASEWMTTIYTVAFAGLLIAAGKTVDRFGARRMVLYGVALFVVGSVTAGLATDARLLLLGRAIEGISGALILPASLSTLTALFTDKARPAAFGVWGAVIGGMAALGPLVGGWLTTNVGWRAVFFVNVPIGIVLIGAAWFILAESIPAHPADRLDLIGTALLVIVLGTVTFGLVQGQRYGWIVGLRDASFGLVTLGKGGPSESLIAFLITLVAAVAFALRERQRGAHGKETYLAWDLFELHGFRYGNFAGAGVNFGEVGLVFVLPLFLQAAQGRSAWNVGLILAGLAVGAFVGGGVAGQLARRVGERIVVEIGLALLVIGIGGAAWRMKAAITAPELISWLSIAGLGIGAAQAQLSNLILDRVPDDKAGQASGTQSTFRQLGATFGIALVGTMLVFSLSHGVKSALEAQGSLPASQVEQITNELAGSGGTALLEMRSQSAMAPLLDTIDSQFANAVRRAMFVALAGFAIAFLATLKMPKASERRGA
jgi:EmrB/QacA subfamily drug resistance transporter